MKSRVGLGHIYGNLGQAPDVSPPEDTTKSREDTAEDATPADLVSVTVHVDRNDLNELLRKAERP